MARKDPNAVAPPPGRVQKLRNRLPNVAVSVPVTAGMAVVVRTPAADEPRIPPTLATVLMSYWTAANTTTLYLEQKVSLLAGVLPGDKGSNMTRLRPLTRLASLPQRTATKIVVPALQSRLPNPVELAATPVRQARRQLSRAGSLVLSRVRRPRNPVVEQLPEFPSRSALALARTPALLAVSAYLYSVGFVAISVHVTTERLRSFVLKRV